MKKRLLSVAILSLLNTGPLLAMTVEERLAAMEQRIIQLEQRVATQDTVIEAKQKQIEQLQGDVEQQAARPASTGSWTDNIEVGGVIEVEANHVSESGSADTSDIYVAWAELDISAAINSWTVADLVLLYEDGDNGINIDTATISIADPDSFWAVTAGKTVVPFGIFAANTLSDPLTLELGETSEDTLIGAIDSDGFNAGIYTYAGDIDNNDIGSYGAFAGYARESDSLAYDVSVGYTNNLGDSDALTEGRAVPDSGNHVDAWYASLGMAAGELTINAEYVAAVDDFDAGVYGANKISPSAWNIEGAYGFSIAEKDSIFVIGYSTTEEAADTGLAEKRLLTALSIGILENTALTFEYASEKAYNGTDTDTVTGQLAVEF